MEWAGGRKRLRDVSKRELSHVTLSSQAGKDGQMVPERLDQPLDSEGDGARGGEEEQEGVLPSYYNGRWYHAGKWHKLKEEKG